MVVVLWSSSRGLGPLVLVEGTMDRWDYIEIMRKHLLSYIKKKFKCKGYHYQDDNAPVHTCKMVLHYAQI